jgi:hypothetical protein
MAVSKTSLYQGAILLLKQNAVDVTITEDSAFVNVLDLVYDRAIAFCLSSGDWNFATRTVSIEASEDVSSGINDYSYAIEKPSDYAGRIVAISGNQRFDPPLDDYHEDGGFGGYIWCDVDPLYFRYISNSVEYGLDLSNWHPAFERYVEHELAWRIAPHLTQMSANEKEEFRKERKRALRDAQAKDARNQGAQPYPQGRLVQSRGFPSTRSRWRW